MLVDEEDELRGTSEPPQAKGGSTPVVRALITAGSPVLKEAGREEGKAAPTAVVS